MNSETGLIQLFSQHFPIIYEYRQMFFFGVLATIGIALYAIALWVAGVTQGLMWRALEPDGTLTYTFAESVKASFPYYVVRLIGGVLYLSGMIVMAYNVWRTVRGDTKASALPATVETSTPVTPAAPQLNTASQSH